MLELDLLFLSWYEGVTNEKSEKTMETWSYKPSLNSLSHRCKTTNLGSMIMLRLENSRDIDIM